MSIFPEINANTSPDNTSWHNLRRNKYAQILTDAERIEEEVEETIHNGLDFLADSQQSNGIWSDFTTRSSGIGTEWVTGYVLTALPEIITKSEFIDIEDTCINLLSSQRHSGGWGYSDDIPPDADSTAVVTRALVLHYGTIKTSGIDISTNINRSRDFLLQCQSSDGGFQTYPSPSPLREYRNEGEDVEFSGWCKPHASVTAAALIALYDTGMEVSSNEIKRGLYHLRQSRSDEGLWKPYWWHGPVYPTNICVEAIYYLGAAEDKNDLKRTGKTILNMASNGRWSLSENDQPSPFATALCLRTIMLCDLVTDDIFESVRWLLNNQQEDGSWRSVPMMQIPPPNVVDADKVEDWRVGGKGVGSRTADQNRIFTTSTVLRTLFDFAWYVGL